MLPLGWVGAPVVPEVRRGGRSLCHHPWMKRSRTVIAAVAVAALSAVASPALAAQQSLQDAAGDASGPGLDITRLTVRNLDHAVVAKIRFVKSVRGDLIISLDPRAGRGVRLVSEYRPVAHTKNF